jgi:hypothetical protein
VSSGQGRKAFAIRPVVVAEIAKKGSLRVHRLTLTSAGFVNCDALHKDDTMTKRAVSWLSACGTPYSRTLLHDIY